MLLIAAIIAAVSAAVSHTTYSTTTDIRYKSTAMDRVSTTAALADADNITGCADEPLTIYRENPVAEFSTPEEEAAYYEQFIPRMRLSIIPKEGSLHTSHTAISAGCVLPVRLLPSSGSAGGCQTGNRHLCGACTAV